MSESATGQLPSHGAVSPAPQNVGEGFKKAKHEMTAAEAPEGFWPNVMFFVENFGHMMSRIVLTLLYAVLITPVGIFYRFLADPFLSRYRGTSFTPWKSENSTVDQARRQS
ncbi:MAG: hypothetical protein ACF8XB_21025 [Planctomycetota bacterium JB042]